MVAPENRQFGCIELNAGVGLEEQRLRVLAELGLLAETSVAIFEEATQAVSNFLETPICILGIMDRDQQSLKAAVGLSQLGDPNHWAIARSLNRSECFCTQVVETHQVLAIRDTAADPTFAKSLLVQQYGIRAYLGVPLLTSGGYCAGTLAVMDLAPRTFSSKDIQFLQLTARWSMSELERYSLEKARIGGDSEADARTVALHLESGLARKNSHLPVKTLQFQSAGAVAGTDMLKYLDILKVQLIAHLTGELRNPLTSVMGMASVLSREVYGRLKPKQKEYIDIIHESGRYLLSLLDEILALGDLDELTPTLQITPTDIEMLCQQVINNLQQVGNRREQEIRLSVEPGNRIWRLDKEKVQQILYHLMFKVIQVSHPGGVVRIHVSRKTDTLNIVLWVSHPWLGEGLRQIELFCCELPNAAIAAPSDEGQPSDNPVNEPAMTTSTSPNAAQCDSPELVKESNFKHCREQLGLLLSCDLAELHGGNISIQGSVESGYRYMVSLPLLET